jgi:hypothetical protein
MIGIAADTRREALPRRRERAGWPRAFMGVPEEGAELRPSKSVDQN